MQNFSDIDILNYLMTSEFNEGLTPDEFKFLLSKFRYYYRLVYAKSESLNISVDKLTNDFKSLKEQNDINIKNLNSEKEKVEMRYKELVNKKLTWKERIKGKIIIKENEVDGIQKD